MPEVRDYFPHLDALDISGLHLRKAEILAPVDGNHMKLPDDSLAELLAISRALRKKAAVSGGGRKKAAGASTKKETTLEDLV